MDDPSFIPSGNKSSSRDVLPPNYLHHIGVSKQSHKIGKASAPPLMPQAPPPSSSMDPDHLHHRPPVYTVDKSDFRLVVQRLTGSLPSERVSESPPAPIRPPKPPSSRMQRIKPPPLAPIARSTPEITPNPLRFASQLEATMGLDLGNPLGSFAAPTLAGILPLPLSPPEIPLLSPTCSMQLRSPPPRFPSLSPKPNLNAVDSVVPFSPSSPWSRFLLPSSPGFLRLPVTTSK